MTYELAKELKDAGFPQTQKMAYWMLMKKEGEKPFIIHPDWDRRKVSSYQDAYPDADLSACPTLEELIEAVQKFRSGNFHLRSGEYTDGVWKAELFGSLRNFGIGPTPTEAVARLWLALQKKV